MPFLENAVKRDPALLPAHASLGMAYSRIGKSAEAAKHLEPALPLDRDGSLHCQLARALQATGAAEKSDPTQSIAPPK